MTDVLAQTRAWVDAAVIGLNLCPFAKAVQARNQIRYVESAALDVATLQDDLLREMHHLVACDAEETDTTLLVHPLVLPDFLDFNDFLGVAEELVDREDLTGILQVASFHPRFQFAGTDANDVTNATNRSPYPTLHLLREASVDRAVAAFPNAEAIYERNILTMEGLGTAGWKALTARIRSADRHARFTARSRGA